MLHMCLKAVHAMPLANCLARHSAFVIFDDLDVGVDDIWRVEDCIAGQEEVQYGDRVF
jgi:hypothetical protein